MFKLSWRCDPLKAGMEWFIGLTSCYLDCNWKSEAQAICFVGSEEDYQKFLAQTIYKEWMRTWKRRWETVKKRKPEDPGVLQDQQTVYSPRTRNIFCSPLNTAKWHSAWNTVGTQQILIEQLRNACSQMADGVHSEMRDRRAPHTEFTYWTEFAEDCTATADVGGCRIFFYEVFKNKIVSHLFERVPMKNRIIIWIIE